MKKGIDICYHNGSINFDKFKKAGYSFIIPRDGWGEDGVDPKLIEYVNNAKAAGVEVPGVYHFIYAANESQVIQNAKRAIENVKKAGLPETTVIWCDLEYDTVDNARDYRRTNLTPAMQKKFIEVFCDYILSQGYPTGAYVNQDYMSRVVGKDFGKKYDLWLADYEGGVEYQCLYRQTSGTGVVPGINSNVDTDEFYGQYTAGTAKPKTTNTGGTNMSKSPFSDVKTTDKKYDHIKACYDAGLIKGYSDGSFRPNDPITRADICIVLDRLMKKAGIIK